MRSLLLLLTLLPAATSVAGSNAVEEETAWLVRERPDCILELSKEVRGGLLFEDLARELKRLSKTDPAFRPGTEPWCAAAAAVLRHPIRNGYRVEVDATMLSELVIEGLQARPLQVKGIAARAMHRITDLEMRNTAIDSILVALADTESAAEYVELLGALRGSVRHMREDVLDLAVNALNQCEVMVDEQAGRFSELGYREEGTGRYRSRPPQEWAESISSAARGIVVDAYRFEQLHQLAIENADVSNVEHWTAPVISSLGSWRNWGDPPPVDQVERYAAFVAHVGGEPGRLLGVKHVEGTVEFLAPRWAFRDWNGATYRLIESVYHSLPSESMKFYDDKLPKYGYEIPK